MAREYSDEVIETQAIALMSYLAKPDNRGAMAWLASKDFSPEDRTAILTRLGDLETEERMLPELNWPEIIARVELARRQRERDGLPGFTVLKIGEPERANPARPPAVKVLIEARGMTREIA